METIPQLFATRGKYLRHIASNCRRQRQEQQKKIKSSRETGWGWGLRDGDKGVALGWKSGERNLKWKGYRAETARGRAVAEAGGGGEDSAMRLTQASHKHVWLAEPLGHMERDSSSEVSIEDTELQIF